MGGTIAAMVVGLALLLAAAFGAGDQYLGSLTGSGHLWAAGWSSEVSLLSAPWVVLAFAAGRTQREPRRAALLGLGCTFAAVLGYFLLTDSPLENAHYSLAGARAFVLGDPGLFVGGLATGPLFGWFGQQWRVRRARLGALVTAAALCLEPLVRRATVNPIRFSQVWIAEVAAGLALAAYVAASRLSRRA